MKVTDFISALSGGAAKTNRFTMIMTPPTSIRNSLLSGGDNSSLQKMLLLCDAAQLPGININTTPVRTFGEVREIPYEINYEPVTLSFYVDAGMNVKRMFDAWIQSIQLGDSRKFAYYNDYVTTMSIFVQDSTEKNRYIVDMFEAYPKTVSAVQMDYSSRDLMKINVTMMYKYWRSNQLDNGTLNAAGNRAFGSTVSAWNTQVNKTFDYSKTVTMNSYLNNFQDVQLQYNLNNGYTPETIANATSNVRTYYR